MYHLTIISFQIRNSTPHKNLETVDGEMERGGMEETQTPEEDEIIQNIPTPSCKLRKVRINNVNLRFFC